MNNPNLLYLLIPAVIFLAFTFMAIVFHFKKKTVIKKVNALSFTEKNAILNNLAKPVGYMFNPYQGIFVSRLDAPQKVFGYTSFYDFAAAYVNMVFDYETIYFNYMNRTWLIEMWKGQYGINAGCELGIYYADAIIPPDKYSSTLFKAVNNSDMLDISLKLNRRCRKGLCRYSKLGFTESRHWWSTIFKMGTFDKPENLFVNTAIKFKDYPMMYSFLDSFRSTFPDTTYKVSGLTVYFTFDKSNRRYNFIKRIVRRIALFFCNIYTKLFNFLTRPYVKTLDKLIYIYYYLPVFIRYFFKNKS